MWDTHRKRSIVAGNERVKKSPLLLEFKGHQYGVQSCAISGERLVMSADIDSCVLVSGAVHCSMYMYTALCILNAVSSTYMLYIYCMYMYMYYMVARAYVLHLQYMVECSV